MNTPLPDALVSDDTRAVTPVLAFVLLFGIGVIAFSGYQAYQVPQQNQAVEFEHLQTVENDLVQVRAAVLRAGQSDVRELATVQLGTTYPARLFAINPPPPSGTLQTSDRYDIQFESSSDLPTRFLKYEPGYNELPSSPVWYENSVLYREAGDDIIILEDQELVTDDGTLELTALQQEFREQGAGRVTVNFYPKQDRTGSTIEGDVTIPTRLDGEEYWDDALSDVGIYAGVDTGEDSPYPDGVNALGFENVSDINVNAVGIRDPPDDGLKNVEPNGNSDDDLPPVTDQVAYAGSNNGNLRTLFASGTIRPYATTQVQTIGPAKASLDGDGNIDIPYVGNNGDLKAIDSNDEIIILDDSWGGKQARIGVGDWNDDGTIEVIYVGNNNKLKSATADGISDKLPGNTKAKSIAGVGPFGESGNPAIVFVGSNNQEIKYAEPSGQGSSIDVTKTGVKADSSNAIGPPADYDDDSELEVPIVNGNNNIELIDRSGQDGTVDPNIGVAQAPMGKLQVAGDATPEIVFVDSNNNFIQYVNPDTDETGSFEVKADTNYGVN